MEVVIKSITTDNLTKYIAEFARVCYRRDEKKSTADQDLNRCISLWKMGHNTPFESINIDFLVENASRSLLAQITRYRHTSPNVESQRYVTYRDDIDFIIPESVEKSCALANGEFNVHSFFAYAQDMYVALLDDNIKPEDARCVLPGATPTRFRMAMNLKEFFHIYKQRSSPEAQKEIRDLVEMMFSRLHESVDNNSQKLLTFIQKNVKLSIQSLIKDIENLCLEDYYVQELWKLLDEYKEFV